MTKKDFEVIAGAIKEYNVNTGKDDEYLTHVVSQALSKTNRSFDFKKFWNACKP